MVSIWSEACTARATSAISLVEGMGISGTDRWQLLRPLCRDRTARPAGRTRNSKKKSSGKTHVQRPAPPALDTSEAGDWQFIVRAAAVCGTWSQNTRTRL
eukprot:scaffold988_cov105-Isochrysis_galbana.AAC.13